MKLQANVKSEEAPKTNDGPVKVVTANTFDEIVNSGNDVLIGEGLLLRHILTASCALPSQIGELSKGPRAIMQCSILVMKSEELPSKNKFTEALLRKGCPASKGAQTLPCVRCIFCFRYVFLYQVCVL